MAFTLLSNLPLNFFVPFKPHSSQCSLPYTFCCMVAIKPQTVAPVRAVSFHSAVSRWHGTGDTATQKSRLHQRNASACRAPCLGTLEPEPWKKKK